MRAYEYDRGTKAMANVYFLASRRRRSARQRQKRRLKSIKFVSMLDWSKKGCHMWGGGSSGSRYLPGGGLNVGSNEKKNKANIWPKQYMYIHKMLINS